MALTVNEQNISRLHLVGSLSVVLTVALLLAGFFSWQNISEQQASLERIERASQEQTKARLGAETRSTLDYLDFTRAPRACCAKAPLSR